VDTRRRLADAALKKWNPFASTAWFRKCAARFSSCTGRKDEQVPLAHAQACTTPPARATRRLRVFTAEEGGAQHCQRDYLTLVVATIGDWLEDKLVRA